MRKVLFSFVAIAALAAPASAQWVHQTQDPTPQRIVEQVGIDQHLNTQLPLDAHFIDENGRDIALGQLFGKRPVILALVYYECPMLCNQVLNGLTRTLRVTSLNAGTDFDVVVVSFDPNEGTKLAGAKKAAYVSRYGRPGTEAGWHFLTGTEPNIKRLTSAAGFRYQWQADTQQWAHTAGVMVVTPKGVLSRYFYGIEFGTRDLRLGLVEASNEKIGTLADQALLLCYRYDPMKGSYGLMTMRLIQIGAVLTLIALGSYITIMLRRERTHQLPPAPAHAEATSAHAEGHRNA